MTAAMSPTARHELNVACLRLGLELESAACQLRRALKQEMSQREES